MSMEFLDNLIEKYREIENALAILLMETESKIAEMERLNMDENKISDTANESQHKGVYVPLAAYEMQQERFFDERKDLMDRAEAEKDKIRKEVDKLIEEKDKMRKHYRRIIIAVSTPLAIMIIGIFAAVFYFMANFEVAALSQDGDGLNNFVNRSSSVEVNYGAEDNNDQLSRPEQNTEGNPD